ncbi:MAG: YihY/virulence factor BrkB family protein, partial [Candidatus Acidiferrales bacterium]
MCSRQTFSYQRSQPFPLRRVWRLREHVSFPRIAKRIWHHAQADDCLDLAAQMSFYFVLALFPFLIFLAAVVGSLPFTGLWDGVVTWMMRYVPVQSQHLMLVTILGLTRSRIGFLSFGLLGAAWSASSGFVTLQKSLSRAYGVPETRGFWKKRSSALLMLGAVSAFFIASFGLMTAGHWLGTQIASRIKSPEPFQFLWEVGRWIATLALLNAGIALIDYALPNVKRPWRWVTPGGFVFVIFSVLASLAFNAYVRYFAFYNQTYGTLAGFVILITWIYLTSFILLVGAETNSVLEEIRETRG